MLSKLYPHIEIELPTKQLMSGNLCRAALKVIPETLCGKSVVMKLTLELLHFTQVVIFMIEVVIVILK